MRLCGQTALLRSVLSANFFGGLACGGQRRANACRSFSSSCRARVVSPPHGKTPARLFRAAPPWEQRLFHIAMQTLEPAVTMSISRRTLFALCAALLASSLFFGATALAACTETKAVIYLSAPEGGQTDLIYLPLLKAWTEDGEYGLMTERAPGRGGSYALSRLLLEKRDECALAAMQLPAFHFLTRAPNRMAREQEIEPLAVFAYAPHALWVRIDSPFQSLNDLADKAREKNEAGRLVIAGVGSYTDQHLANLALDRALGIKSLYYPLRGSAEAAALAEKNMIHACWGYALPPESMPGMRPLAVASRDRSAALPATPTFQQQGIDFFSGSHFGAAMAAEAPERARENFAERLARLMQAPGLKEQLAGRGVLPLALTGEDLKEFIRLHAQEAERLLEEYPLIPRLYRGE